MAEYAFPCPCCGRLVHEEVGSHSICPVCCWEDDPVQLRWPGVSGGANKVSLFEAQGHYQRSGASGPWRVARVRTPRADEPRDPGFRFADPVVDDFESPEENAGEWPQDRTVLYWWRPTFWRR